MFAAATAWLEAHAEQVNAVNVFPVPDGDTGTNMLLTMRSTMREADRCEDERAGAMLAAMSHGALMGARGNSGVILSQIVNGLAKRVDGADKLDASLLAHGLDSASQAAYKAVADPTEGTILTVIRDVSEAVARNGAPDVGGALSTAVAAAKESVERTPTLLPVLAEAGVVDAGGLGLLLLLEGMLRHLRGEAVEVSAEVSTGAIESEWLTMTEERHAAEESPYGYCTEVLIGGERLDVEPVRSRMEELGDSVIVVGDETLIRVHLHTDDPGAVLTLGTNIGQLVQVKVDNIREQAEHFVRMHEEQAYAGPSVAAEAPAGLLTCVAVAAGAGMAEVFRELDSRTRIVPGGQTMNPSTQDLVDAINACATDDVAVLPNNKNVIMAAEQAIAVCEKRATVIPSRSIPQGIAAMIAIRPDDSVEENLQAMREATASVSTIEVTKAVRSTKVGDVEVAEGQWIAIVDDELTVAAESAAEAALQALEDVITDDTELITLYFGKDVPERDARELENTLRERFRDHELDEDAVQVIFGGQPHYDYIISVE